jgi:hypothetical protein
MDPRYTDSDTAYLPVIGDGSDSTWSPDAPPEGTLGDGDIASHVRARVPLRWKSRTTLTLVSTGLIVAGFLGGLLVQKNFGATATTSTAFPGAAGGNGFGQGASAGAGGPGGATASSGSGATTGTVKLVDGNTVYLTTASGAIVTVKVSDSTALLLSQAAALEDLPAGAAITVQGTTAADGSITATTVTTQK